MLPMMTNQEVQMDTVEFADGTAVQCGKFLFLPNLNVLYILIDGVSWQEAASIFADEEKTKSITYCGNTVTGYTHIDYMMAEAGGIKACLSPSRV